MDVSKQSVGTLVKRSKMEADAAKGCITRKLQSEGGHSGVIESLQTALACVTELQSRAKADSGKAPKK